jgi:hypothetical protein
MRRHLTRPTLLIPLVIVAIIAALLGRKWKEAAERGGQQPAEPFRIAGNLYFVGANDVSAFLRESVGPVPEVRRARQVQRPRGPVHRSSGLPRVP